MGSQWQTIVDAIPALAWSAGCDGIVTSRNQHWVDYAGLSPEPDTKVAWTTIAHPDDREILMAWWQSPPDCAGSLELNARLRRLNGEYRRFKFRGSPLGCEPGEVPQWLGVGLDLNELSPDSTFAVDEAGMPVSTNAAGLAMLRYTKWYGTDTDIEDRKRAEGALRASEHTLRTILNSIAGLVTTHAPTGELELANQPFLDYTGETTEELRDFAHVVHPDDFSSAMAQWAHSLASGEALSVEARLRRKDGAYRWFNANVRPLRDPEGRIIRWCSLLTDIEQQKAMEVAKGMEESLRVVQDRLSRAAQTARIAKLSTSIAHEINQPLAAIVLNGHACLRWLAAEPPHLPNACEAAKRIVANGKDAGDVVRRIRALFKDAEPERTTLNLNEVIHEVMRLLRSEIVRERIVVETRFAEDLPDIAGDRIQLQQLVLNLLLNGIEAMHSVTDRPKQLVVSSKQQGSDHVLVEISDLGEGLKDAERIFEAFYTIKPNGKGMGLAICRSIAESHDGRLWAESRSDGATFCFILPVCSRVEP